MNTEIKEENLKLTDEELRYLAATESGEIAYSDDMQLSILVKVYRIEKILQDQRLIEDQVKRVKELVQK